MKKHTLIDSNNFYSPRSKEELFEWNTKNIPNAISNKKKISLIIPPLPGIHYSLYLGNKVVANDNKLLHKLNITAIVNLGGPNMFEDEFTYHKITVSDKETSDIYQYMPDSVSFIDEHIQQGAVLIHCKGGMNRSPAITIAYIMKFAKMTMTESMTFTKFRRNCINSTRFEKDLLKYQKYLTK